MYLSVSSAARRREIGLVLGAVMALNTGCYTYQPIIDAQPQAGQDVQFELNDQGRAQLSNELGAGVLTVEGLLQENTNDQYVVSVSSVSTIQGGTAHWGGERVMIPAAAVSRSSSRTLSRGRSWLLAGVVAAGIVVFAATRSLVGGGSGVVDGSSTQGSGNQK